MDSKLRSHQVVVCLLILIHYSALVFITHALSLLCTKQCARGFQVGFSYGTPSQKVSYGELRGQTINHKAAFKP